MTIEEITTEARGMGWVPEEEFRGDKTRWVDAQTFVDRGHTVLPLIKKQKEQLEGELQTVRQELTKLGDLYKSSQESIAALQEFHKTNTRQKVEQARAQILTELKAARKENDTDLEVDLEEELRKTDKALALTDTEDRTKPPETKPTASADQPGLDPTFVDWTTRNKWVGVDVRKTSLANGIANLLRADPDNDGLVGKAFWDKVSEELALREKGHQVDKVNGARHSGDFGGNQKKTYADLDAEAKKVCDGDAKKFVGEGKMFKTVADWRQYYADTVLGE